MIRTLLIALVFFSFSGCSSRENGSPLKLGYEPAFFSMNRQTSRMKGFFDDFVLMIEKKTGIRLEMIQAAEDSLTDLLERGTVDLVFSDLDNGIVTQNRFVFSIPLIYNGYYLVTQKADMRTLCQLEEKKVLVMNNEAVTNFIACYPRVDFGFYADDKEAFVSLSKTLCSAVIVPVTDFQTYSSEFQVNKEMLTNKFFRLIAKKEDKRFKEIEKAIQQLEKEGVIKELTSKWMLEPS
ncbi:MAG: substrate-binding periplasmic protein [Chlamydiia bacterium]